MRSMIVVLAAASVLLAGCTTSGCGEKSATIAVAADATVHGSLLKAKAGVDRLCSESKPVLTVETCKELYSALTPALEAGQAYNRSVRDQDFGQMAQLAARIGRLMEVVSKLVPKQDRNDLEVNLRLALAMTP